MDRLQSIWLLCSGKDNAIQHGARLIRDVARSHGSRLTLFAAVEGSDDDLLRTPLGRQLQQLLHDSKQRQLQDLAHRLGAELGAERVRSVLVDAPSAWHALTTAAIEEAPELVIVPADAEQRHPAFGFTSQHLFRKCPSPVWALTPGFDRTPTRVLIAVDPGVRDSDQRKLSMALMRFALRFSAPLEAEVHLVHAWRAWGETLASPRLSRATVRDYVEQARQTATQLVEEVVVEAEATGRVADRHFLKGDPAVVVPRLANALQAEVVVLGSAARTGLRGFLIGSVAETVLDRLECSAIVVKPPSYVSPVARAGK